MKFKCKHILLSYDKAENTSHERPLGVAVEVDAIFELN